MGGGVTAYYNEIDPHAAAWLRELVRQGHIADGEVDERSILDVRPADLAGFTQCHFFAGIGGWSYALRLAGWPDDRPVWTGSPPCQPFSTAGKQLGRDDPRHLAPHFVSLVRACRPAMLFGEQVASAEVFGKSASGAKRQDCKPPEWAWIDDLSDRLEAAYYAVGASDIPAAFVGAPHIRQRTFFGAIRLANASIHGQQRPGEMGRSGDPAQGKDRQEHRTINDGGCGGMADADAVCKRMVGLCDQPIHQWSSRGAWSGLGRSGEVDRPGQVDNPWRDADWLFCRDERWRPVEPGTFPLADGIPARVGRLRGYGNAIVPQVAAEFVTAFMEALQ